MCYIDLVQPHINDEDNCDTIDNICDNIDIDDNLGDISENIEDTPFSVQPQISAEVQLVGAPRHTETTLTCTAEVRLTSRC